MELVVEQILVVDDERSLAKLVASYLGREGCQVECAFDGPQALAAARARRPDVVVLDLMLPGWMGWRCAGCCVPSPTAM
jgi:DNA-binding response OmpR family regulator